jgi:hypothetical protein
MLGVTEIDACFETWALKFVPLTDDSDKSLYSWVKEQLENCRVPSLRAPIGQLRFSTFGEDFRNKISLPATP